MNHNNSGRIHGVSKYSMLGAKLGFTLAEVLITLGIIGIVAAMTIPTLISNIYGTRYKSQLKKTISTLAQAGKLNQAHYDWTYSDIGEQCGGTDFMKHTSETKTSLCAILNSNLSGIQGIYRNQELKQRYGYNLKTYTPDFKSTDNQFTMYLLNDGAIVGIRSISTASGCELKVGARLGAELAKPNLKGNIWVCTGYIDVNGVSLPNEETRCSDGTTNKDIDAPCVVKNKDIKDVYPIVFYNDTVSPATNAGKFVLQSTK